jgi:hypothetical protein
LMYGKIKDMFYETRSRGVFPARLKNSRTIDRCSPRTLY